MWAEQRVATTACAVNQRAYKATTATTTTERERGGKVVAWERGNAKPVNVQTGAKGNNVCKRGNALEPQENANEP